MNTRDVRRWLGAALAAGFLATGYAQSPRTPIPGGTEPPKLLFHEGWTRAPLSQPMTQANLANQQLTLHIYGDPNHIRKAMHPLDDYTYTGESTSNWALTVSDKTALWDVTGGGKIRFKTQNTGYRFLHVVIKTADGRYFVFNRRAHAVFTVPPTRDQVRKIVEIGTEPGRVLRPTAFDVANDETFVVADAPFDTRRVQVFHSTGASLGGFTIPGREVPLIVMEGMVLSGIGSLEYTGRSMLMSQPQNGSLVVEYGLDGRTLRTFGQLRPTGQEQDRDVHLGLNAGLVVINPRGGFYYVFQDLHWRNLLMTDTPTNASNRRQPDPKRVPIIPTSRGTPDLRQVEEVGFSDLVAGGWIPATSRVAFFELYGKAVARAQ